MWQSMRVMRCFTVAEVMATAEVGASAATKYVRYLLRAGYLRCVVAKRNGRTGGHAQYRLVKDTGPLAPRVGKQAIRDPNLEPTDAEPTVSIPRSEYERALRCIHLCESIRSHGAGPTVKQCAAQALEVAR
jgi:hypothetical protein